MIPIPNLSPGAAYGWRARFGLLQPSMVCDTNAYEFYLMAPPGVQMLLTSLGIGDGPRSQEYARAIDQIEAPLRRVLARGVDVIVQAGVPPIVERGWGFEDELRARVAQWTDVPFASDVGCCIAAMQALGMRRIGLLVADDMQAGFAAYLNHAGIDVIAARSVPVPAGLDPGALPLSVPYHGAVALWQSAPEMDGIWIPIAARPSVGMIADLERALGVPVVTSAQAMMWRGLQLARVPTDEVVGYGRLFQT